MEAHRFTATLLRQSAGGFAGLAASRTAERAGVDGRLEGGFDAWREHFRTLVLELAAAVDDGGREEFAARVAWARDAFLARGGSIEVLAAGVEELGAVLEESLPEAARATIPAFLEAAREELRRAPAPEEPGAGEDVPGAPARVLDEIASAYVEALRDGDAPRAIEQVLGAIRDGRLGVPDAIEGVLTRALRAVGREWHRGTMNVAEEHFATQTTGRLLERILVLAPPATAGDETVVLTMVEGDAHDLGLRLVAALFELDGWRTLGLGGNTPAADLARIVERHEADLVVLGATLSTQREVVARTIEALRAARPQVLILVGGPAFRGREDRAAELGADGCSTRPREAVRLGRKLVGA